MTSTVRNDLIAARALIDTPEKTGDSSLTFQQMVAALRIDGVFTRAQIAKALGISPQYLGDLEQGRRKPSVRVVNRICEYMGRKTLGRREWHVAAARACGWEV